MRQWTDEEKRQVAALLHQKLRAREIGAKFGRSKSSVISLVNRDPDLKKIGLPRAPRRARDRASA